MIALDTSVLVAAFSSWHEFHDLAVTACRQAPLLPAHAYIESFAVLTRMPEPFRADATLVADYLNRLWADRLILPSSALVASVPRTLCNAGLSGGATYDALIAMTSQESGATLLSLDRRASRTYLALAVEHRFLTR